MILCLWSPLHPLSKLLAIQGHAQNVEEQLWMESRREVSIVSYRPVSSSDLKQERSFFWSECLNINFFATGCSFLSQNLEVLFWAAQPVNFAPFSKVIKQTRSYWRLHCTVLCTVKILLLLHFSCDFSVWKFAFTRGQGGYHSAIVSIGRSLWQYERSSGSP